MNEDNNYKDSLDSNNKKVNINEQSADSFVNPFNTNIQGGNSKNENNFQNIFSSTFNMGNYSQNLSDDWSIKKYDLENSEVYEDREINEFSQDVNVPIINSINSDDLANDSIDKKDSDIEILTLEDDKVGVDNLINGTNLSDTKKTEPSKFSKNRIIIIIISILALMIIAVSQTLAYNAGGMNTSGDGRWDIAFTRMYQKTKIGKAEEVNSPSFNSLKASFGVLLKEPGDEISYEITIKNRGTIDAVLSNISIIPANNANDLILYYVDGVSIGDVLDAGQEAKMIIIAKYNSNSSVSTLASKEVEVLLNYKQKA